MINTHQIKHSLLANQIHAKFTLKWNMQFLIKIYIQNLNTIENLALRMKELIH